MSLFETPERTVMIEAQDLSAGDVVRFRRRSGIRFDDFAVVRVHIGKPDDPQGVREFTLIEFGDKLEPIFAPNDEEFEVVLS